jgi:hypothetical protein
MEILRSEFVFANIMTYRKTDYWVLALKDTQNTKLNANSDSRDPFWTTEIKEGGDAYYATALGFVKWTYTRASPITIVVAIQRFIRFCLIRVRWKNSLYKKQLLHCTSTLRLLNEDVIFNISKFLYAKNEKRKIVDIVFDRRQLEYLNEPFELFYNSFKHFNRIKKTWAYNYPLSDTQIAGFLSSLLKVKRLQLSNFTP